jgi:hypothetical protein
MKVGDLVKDIYHPQAGIGIVTAVGANKDYLIAVFPVHGPTVVYADEWEVISESWEVISESR